MADSVAAALESLRRFGDQGRIELDAEMPASEIACRARENGLESHLGTLSWTLPSGYREFLAQHNRLSRHREFDGLYRGFVLVDDEEFAELNASRVHLPEHVSRDPGRYLSTNHLVGFAEAGYEAVWCFDISRPGIDGEYPVYYQHQDEPRARYVDGGAWEEAADEHPDFSSFRSWLLCITAALTDAQPPTWVADLGTSSMVWQAREGIFRQASAVLARQRA